MGTKSPVSQQGSQLSERVRKALDAIEASEDSYTAEDFSVFDHLHSRGRSATQELSEFLSLHPGSRLLDIGCGIGGPARFLAERFVCDIYGIDISESFCETAQTLNRLCGLDKRIHITQADACRLPYEDAYFDAVWTQHVTMCVPDKPTLYGEIARVLKPGGLFLFHDVFTGETDDVRYPVPWASDAEHSHLIAGEVARDLLADAGFQREIWNDVTTETRLWFLHYGNGGGNKGPLKDITPGLFMGPDFGARIENLKDNLNHNRLRIVQGVFTKV